METVAAAAITGAVSLAVCLVTNAAQQKKTNALIEYKLDELTRRVDKHNNVIERTYKLEKEAALQAERLEQIERTVYL